TALPPLAHSGVTARLAISVKEYDPGAPGKAFIRCFVRNETAKEVAVPLGYDGQQVRLRSGDLLLSRSAPKGRSLLRFVRLAPGQERLVFELPLDEVLVRTGAGSAWTWGWETGLRPHSHSLYLEHNRARSSTLRSRALIHDYRQFYFPA